jgi:hypothetical protein
VTKGNRGNADREHLPGRHDDGKDDGTELLDGIKDCQLAAGRRLCICATLVVARPFVPPQAYMALARETTYNGGDDVVIQHNGIGLEKLHDNRKVARQDQSGRRYTNGGTVDTEHHLEGVHVGSAVLVVDLILPLGRERVETNVHQQKDQTDHLRVLIVAFRFGQNREDSNTNGDQNSLDVLRIWIVGALQQFSHHHDRNDFGAGTLKHNIVSKCAPCITLATNGFRALTF